MIDRCFRLLARFRHPYSLPCEIGDALGLSFSNALGFDELLKELEQVNFESPSLYRDMPKWEVLSLFGPTPKLEQFADRTSLSYPFSYGWIQFDLFFDRTTNGLRRIFLHHPSLPLGTSKEIRLKRT